jgi:hypothetical protein
MKRAVRGFLPITVWLLIAGVALGFAWQMAASTLSFNEQPDERIAIRLNVLTGGPLRNPFMDAGAYMNIFANGPDGRLRTSIFGVMQSGTHIEMALIKENGGSERVSAVYDHRCFDSGGHRIASVSRDGIDYFVLPESPDADCILDERPYALSYTAREVGVTLDDCDHCLKSLLLDFRFTGDAANLQFLGGEAVTEGVRRLVRPTHLSDLGADRTTVTWDDKTLDAKRDLRLVLIGVVVAIAAGAFIESLRPGIRLLSGTELRE